MRVVTIREYRAALAKRTMHGMHHSDRERLHPARQGLFVVGLDNQVQMVRLNREMHNAKVGPLAGSNRALHRFEQKPVAPQTRQALADALGHVHRMPPEMRRTTAVWESRPETNRLAASPASRAAPTGRALGIELLLSRPSHLIGPNSTKGLRH